MLALTLAPSIVSIPTHGRPLMPTIDTLLIPLFVVALAVLCAALVCVTAIVRADRRDVVAVVRALPELAATLIRFRRKRRP
uniref:Plasmid DNA for prg, traR, spdB3, spdB2, traB, rep genes and orf106, orf80, orf73, orf193, orf141 n=1 Tax=Streptomyces viridosporus TaxID=67581 RepID=O70025_STRVD|nr:unnamed protein product [Streptomyces viridosporus]